MQSSTIKTTCPYCGVGCGVLATKTADREITVVGDKTHPANLGRLCSKGSALGEIVGTSHRSAEPLIDGNIAEWPTALDVVAQKFQDTIAEHGPDSVAFYVSGQLLTEDYYVANKLMKGFIGSANIDTNSRLCMSSTAAGHARAFGYDTVPGCYEDLEAASLIVLAGSNLAWCHPVIFQRIKAAKQKHNTKIVVIDPRRTDTCDIADLHLPIKPGQDVMLFSALLANLHEHDALDESFIQQHTQEFEATLTAACATPYNDVLQETGISDADFQAFCRLFREHDKTVTVFSQGINQSTSGTDKVNAIINCHLATGRIGKTGAAPFSITGQPNAMGGREVGGLANMLAAHMQLENAEHRELLGEFWGSQVIPDKHGKKAVALFDDMLAGKVKAVWIMATNPVVSLPNADKVKLALDACDFVVLSDAVANTDTAAYADVNLPAAGWGEKSGVVTNSERRISRQRAIFPAYANAKPDWWIICEVAKRMGFASEFNFDAANEIFDEHARLSGFKNNGDRDFDISGLAGLTVEQYDDMQPVQWPVNSSSPSGTSRFYADGMFHTANQKARFVPVVPKPPANDVSAEYPLILNTGRIRDQWHTMSVTGQSPRLSAHIAEPFISIHPVDAKQHKVADNTLAVIQSQWGSMAARVKISDAVNIGQLFVPIHWTGFTSSHGRVGAVVNPAVDPVSNQPESKYTPVKITSMAVKSHGFILSKRPLPLVNHVDYWVRSTGHGHYRYQIAQANVADLEKLARELMCDNNDAEWIEYFDETINAYRAARMVGGELESCVYIGDMQDLPDSNWLATLFTKGAISDGDRACLLAGKPADGEDIGPIVCACFSVGQNTIKKCMKQDGAKTVADIGKLTNAGTNCGSCIPELKELIKTEPG